MDKQLQQFLTGRNWLREHTPFPREAIDAHIESGHIHLKPGIQKDENQALFGQLKKYFCNRCHNTTQHLFHTFHCARCNQNCTYCRHCIRMGRVSSCSELLLWKGDHARGANAHEFAWSGRLTPLQQKASEELLSSVQQNKSHLLHAVCGAGKTELLFPSIFRCLEQGKRVCVAAPRTDVILELFSRFQKVFPKTTIHALYGGAPDQEGFAELILTTTHQLYRFEQAFDVIFVDEADAFPYYADETLQRAVKKAAKQDAGIHYVTATPTKSLQTTNQSVLSRRYHGHDLPVPRFDSLWGYARQLNKGKVPLKLQQWIEEKTKTNTPFLVFLPTIEMLENFPGDLPRVHAEHPDRKELVMHLREKKIPGLLTTTILERGITIENVHVAVVGAEQKIFTSSALIQISGRVGRSFQYPDGDIVFFHHGISREMDKAQAAIEGWNR
ncbi:DEAD/DEAH box helicase [Psychrobacillus lasiicapitis]|uniref:DEAD/DEAH box helicase n=1 Tax=Psychrobacillus lasiicapitis TaxID=1636719 RepID=A0A544TE70_9BACI|nr:DEAD/DEAH box helicase family protein [Psychrobacillus lasiicapitis]TQR15710.1 DEAD/DEAH box helicase [Psychrobacillus lasiicapitis]